MTTRVRNWVLEFRLTHKGRNLRRVLAIFSSKSEIGQLLALTEFTRNVHFLSFYFFTASFGHFEVMFTFEYFVNNQGCLTLTP